MTKPRGIKFGQEHPLPNDGRPSCPECGCPRTHISKVISGKQRYTCSICGVSILEDGRSLKRKPKPKPKQQRLPFPRRCEMCGYDRFFRGDSNLRTYICAKCGFTVSENPKKHHRYNTEFLKPIEKTHVSPRRPDCIHYSECLHRAAGIYVGKMDCSGCDKYQPTEDYLHD